MAFIQCSLTGTALSWYIRSNDTYKQDWHAFVQALKKNNSLHKRTLTMLKLKPLTYPRKIMKQYATLHSKFNSWLKKAGVMRMRPLLTSNVMKGLPKNVKDFANKRQVKHTSTVLEPSIPFHTLVNLLMLKILQNTK